MHNFGRNTMEDLRKYTRRTELYKLSAEEQTEKMKLVMKEVEKISSYTGVSEEAAYKLFLNGYSVPNELAENKVRSIKIIPEEESLATGYMDYLHRQKKDNMF